MSKKEGIKMKNVTQLNHPLITHKLAILRDEKTGTKEFRELVKEISILLCYEALKDATLEKTVIKTPITTLETAKLNEDNYVFTPILRAGLGMVEGILSVMPNAKIGHIGMYRDENTFEPVNYYFKVPKKIEDKEVIILDPMLATGGSIIDAIDLLKAKGVIKIKALCIIASPEGLENIWLKHPEVTIYCAHIDDKLNENKYIIPGLGDAGDRIFGTK